MQERKKLNADGIILRFQAKIDEFHGYLWITDDFDKLLPFDPTANIADDDGANCRMLQGDGAGKQGRRHDVLSTYSREPEEGALFKVTEILYLNSRRGPLYRHCGDLYSPCWMQSPMQFCPMRHQPSQNLTEEETRRQYLS